MATARITAVQYLAALGIIAVVLNTRPCVSQQLGCFPRQYLSYDAGKSGCRTQVITIMACFGRCHTAEIPILLAPYKESRHNMCSYDQTERKVIQLDDCDSGVNPNFVYYDAVSCTCKLCDNSNTDCHTA